MKCRHIDKKEERKKKSTMQGARMHLNRKKGIGARLVLNQSKPTISPFMSYPML